jgi:hypothetical protein
MLSTLLQRRRSLRGSSLALVIAALLSAFTVLCASLLISFVVMLNVCATSGEFQSHTAAPSSNIVTGADPSCTVHMTLHVKRWYYKQYLVRRHVWGSYNLADGCPRNLQFRSADIVSFYIKDDPTVRAMLSSTVPVHEWSTQWHLAFVLWPRESPWSFGMYIIVIIVIAARFSVFSETSRRLYRTLKEECPQCGYPNAGHRCPECGTGHHTPPAPGTCRR